MATRSFWGNGTPTGSWSLNTDGTPRIVLGNAYYADPATLLRGKNCIGAKVWVPAGQAGFTLEIKLWEGGVNLPGAGSGINLDTDTAVRTATHLIANNAAHWAVVTWGSPYATSANYRIIAVTHEYTDKPGFYHFAGAARPLDAALESLEVAGLYWAEREASGIYGGIFFEVGTSGHTTPGGPVSTRASYGNDVLFDDGIAANVGPTADAGVNQSVLTNSLVTVNGSSSFDTDGTIVTYTWTQVSGPTVTLAGSGVSRTFTPTSPGTYILRLTVTDDDGAVSGPDDVTITVTGGNALPIARAGVDQVRAVGSLVTLNGSASTDADGTITTYQWAQTAGPASVVLAGAGASRTFTPTVTGTYFFELRVLDNAGALSAADGMTVTVNEGGGGGAPSIFSENNNGALTPVARTSWFDGVTQEEIPGFVRSSYYLPGQSVQFSINYNLGFTVEIHRLGYYSSNTGARSMGAPFAGTPTAQPAADIIDDSNGGIDCSAWSVNATWSVPANATPGWYYALLRGTNGTDFGSILFCVSDKIAKKNVVVVASESTWGAAYNGFGSKNLYGAVKGVGAIADRAHAVSYDRPVITQDYVPQTHFFNGEYATLRFLERCGYEIGYTTNEQVHNDPTILDNRSIVIFSGHNEYTSQVVLNKIKSLLNSGVHIVNMAANDLFWRVTYGTTSDSGVIATAGRVMWCFKDTMAGPGGHVAGVQMNSTPPGWTGTWQDTRWPLREPSDGILGDRFIANGIRNDRITVPFAMRNIAMWRNCPAINNLLTGDSFQFGAGSAGMEWDTPSGSIPTVKLSSALIDLEDNSADINGETYVNDGIFEHSITLSRLSETAGYVFNFNTTQWGWVLDPFHLRGTDIVSTVGQQATVNILADLGFLPNPAASIFSGVITYPIPVSNLGVAYGLGSSTPPPPDPDPDPVPDPPENSSLWYSDGSVWYPIA